MSSILVTSLSIFAAVAGGSVAAHWINAAIANLRGRWISWRAGKYALANGLYHPITNPNAPHFRVEQVSTDNG